jgi:hypothetical protein
VQGPVAVGDTSGETLILAVPASMTKPSARPSALGHTSPRARWQRQVPVTSEAGTGSVDRNLDTTLPWLRCASLAGRWWCLLPPNHLQEGLLPAHAQLISLGHADESHVHSGRPDEPISSDRGGTIRVSRFSTKRLHPTCGSAQSLVELSSVYAVLVPCQYADRVVG